MQLPFVSACDDDDAGGGHATVLLVTTPFVCCRDADVEAAAAVGDDDAPDVDVLAARNTIDVDCGRLTERSVDVAAAASNATDDSDGCCADWVGFGGDANSVGGGTYGIGTTSSGLLAAVDEIRLRLTGDVGGMLLVPFTTGAGAAGVPAADGLAVETEAPVAAELMVKTPARRTGSAAADVVMLPAVAAEVDGLLVAAV